jgi:acyl-coenzyme A synthetase/AMP-(fatty) acid ligase
MGSAIAVTSKTFFDKDFWDFFRQVKVTSFGGVPYHYEILKKLKFSKMLD